ncbi:hypothetical protein GE278_09575 [Enterobacteriaceae bacterium Kacie_13]|nr:hypothetical protein GE278_09575 [Enterobacteriaceae bacterium Kacie_13]
MSNSILIYGGCMFLLGYHGTSEVAAIGLTTQGPKESDAYAALGSGLYVARDSGFLVRFFSAAAKQRDCLKLMKYDDKTRERMEFNNSPSGATILKIYSTVSLFKLKNCVWDIMDTSINGISSRDNLNDLSGLANNLQMVIPVEYYKYIRASFCTKASHMNERPVYWPINEWSEGRVIRSKMPLRRSNSF